MAKREVYEKYFQNVKTMHQEEISNVTFGINRSTIYCTICIQVFRALQQDGLEGLTCMLPPQLDRVPFCIAASAKVRCCLQPEQEDAAICNQRN
jgi:hypothetical protein